MIARHLIWIFFSYLLGSLPVGLLLARTKGRDPRKIGSGNIGATNVMRTAGRTIGLITLLGDALKGFLPVWLAIWFGLPEVVVAVIGFTAFLGHLFPLYLRFKGGKGIATALGIFVAFNYVAVLVELLVFAGLLWKWRYVSLGSVICAALMPFILLALRTPAPYVIVAAIIALLAIAKHRANIKRLMAGTESRVGGKGSKSPV